MEVKKLFELQKELLTDHDIFVNPYYDDIWYVNIINATDKCHSLDRLVYDSYDSEKTPKTFDNYEEALEFGINKYNEMLKQ